MYDAIVIGGGHAGCEAALALSRLNKKTLLLTGNLAMVAWMPCNPSIGGSAKGTLVREIDALGGEMGKIADRTCLQMKMLNKSKGPAVWALRVQSDKLLYPREMLKTLKKQDNLDLQEAYVKELIIKNKKVEGVVTEGGAVFSARTVIVTTGTFMEGAILIGDTKISSGPDGQPPSVGLSANLRANGIKTFRLKTGTPPRIKRNSIDFSRMELSPGDGFVHHFSHEKEHLRVLDQEWPCYLIYTQPKTHKIILENLKRSSMYSGLVEGVGPRYCPSIEDKLVRFADKKRHQLFIEPESEFLDDIYLQGFSTSMPKEIQEEMVHSLPGLENAVISKYAHAIEYDSIEPISLKPSLESKIIENLFFAGQVNGSSGYEEAAAQGLMAAINAKRKLDNEPIFVLRRDEAYIGVLIDDLITKGTKEPYRMMTSRAEFRLLLRHDNADLRLTDYGYELGLIKADRYEAFKKKRDLITSEFNRLKDTQLKISDKEGKTSVIELMKRPEAIYPLLKDSHSELFPEDPEIYEQIEIESKYDGYIKKAIRDQERFQKEEAIVIPASIDYDDVLNLATEARAKLKTIRPLTLGQASRISGVNPADLQMLMFYLKTDQRRRQA
ncbi:MAG: tRNA uridine-5-carboxymethylaminomethyl(34) synthesis enzyme MnmG [Acholeplasmataceae bacterium]|nr:tRNA uridine-5-carboxymethylaminomethyl(34) synthesis enzyme MnmG [Acholeplasmataceae bacterium]